MKKRLMVLAVAVLSICGMLFGCAAVPAENALPESGVEPTQQTDPNELIQTTTVDHLHFGPVTLTQGESVKLNAIAVSEDGAVIDGTAISYTLLSKNGVAEMTDGVLKGLKPGAVWVRVSAPTGYADGSTVSMEVKITVATIQTEEQPAQPEEQPTEKNSSEDTVPSAEEDPKNSKSGKTPSQEQPPDQPSAAADSQPEPQPQTVTRTTRCPETDHWVMLGNELGNYVGNNNGVGVICQVCGEEIGSLYLRHYHGNRTDVGTCPICGNAYDTEYAPPHPVLTSWEDDNRRAYGKVCYTCYNGGLPGGCPECGVAWTPVNCYECGWKLEGGCCVNPDCANSSCYIDGELFNQWDMRIAFAEAAGIDWRAYEAR